MKQVHRLTAVIERDGDWYVAICPELNVASQGQSLEEAHDNLVEAVTLFFEEASPSEIAERLAAVHVTQLEVAVG
jgi:predicted RNase H-like HicB family nuclease